MVKKIQRYVMRVAQAIANQSVSFVSLIISLSFISYDKFVQNTEIPVGAVLSAVGQSSVATVSLFTVGVVLFLGVVGVAAVRVARQ